MAFDVTSCRFLSGHWGYTFDCTAVNGTEKVVPKGASDISVACFYIEYMNLVCGSGAGLTIFDGSGGNELIDTITCASQTVISQVYDFRGDPLKTLAEVSAAGAVCVSGAADGLVQGFIKGYWG